ncbi:MAG: class I SAM-dependent methyltransferase [Synechococcales cyanobacterium M58_A2018_015]|nr:class I SAM-dependent methyltransferase [Synechococcales cyanobacterium M58_A2018_015]
MGIEYAHNQLQPLETLLLPRLPAHAKLLDLCCGTGHLTQRLLQNGYCVTGLDGSEAMLNYAHQNAPTANFVLGDARSFALPDRVHGVYCMSASLNHIMSLSDLQAVFTCVYAILEDNGWFLFDLNHPAQMQKWWIGQIVEGEIRPRFAWYLTPLYSATTDTGYFQITLFQAPVQAPASPRSSLWQGLKQGIYSALTLPWLTRLRLKVLAQFDAWQPDWQRSTLRYDVRGYPESDVRAALQAAGFSEIQVSTLDGSTPVDANHSAYFLCRKSVGGTE